MIDELVDGFAATGHCAAAWRDYVWDLRAAEEPLANRARAQAYETRRALRSEADEPDDMRAIPAAELRRCRSPVTRDEVLRVLRAAG